MKNFLILVLGLLLISCATNDKNNISQRYVVYDGKPGKKYDSIAYSLALSRDGLRYAYVASHNGVKFVVTNEDEGKYYKRVDGLSYNSSSDIITYIARDSDKEHIVVNGAESISHDAIRKYKYSPDGKRLAYWAKDYSTKSTLNYLVVDDVMKQLHEDATIRKIKFSPDSRHLAYDITIHGKNNFQTSRVVSEGVSSESYESIRNIYFTADSAQLIFIGENADDSKSVVKANIPSEAFDRVYGVTFSKHPNGNLFAYIAEKNDEHYVIWNGIKSQPYKRVFTPLIFSKNDKQLTYTVVSDYNYENAGQITPTTERFGDLQGFRISEPEPIYKTVTVNENITTLSGPEAKQPRRFLSNDGKHYAYTVYATDLSGNSTSVVYVDGVAKYEHKGKVRDYVFSADGQSIAYQVEHSDVRRSVAINGREGVIHAARFIENIQLSQDGKHFIYNVKMSAN